MNSRVLFLKLSLSAAIFFSIIIQTSAHPQNKPEISNNIIPVLHLKGTGYQRGIQHGAQLKKQIDEIFTIWKNDIKTKTRRDADSVITEFLSGTNFEPAIKKYTPEILDEVRGIAEASGQTYKDVFAFQLVDEFWVYFDKQKYGSNHHCSGLGVAATKLNPAIVAQNLDLNEFFNGYQVLLHITGSITEPDQYILSYAGLVGATGMNEKRIGLCVNTLMELKASTDGLPVAYIVRGVLKCLTGTDALSFLQNTRHASGQNYILGTQNDVYDFEASANKVVRFIPNNGNETILYHTNHSFNNHDVKEWYEKYHEYFISEQGKKSDSGIRLTALESRLSKSAEAITVDLIKSTLRSKDDARSPVCRPFAGKDRVFTLGSVIYKLGLKPSVLVTSGPPDKSEYQEYYFN